MSGHRDDWEWAGVLADRRESILPVLEMRHVLPTACRDIGLHVARVFERETAERLFQRDPSAASPAAR